jgi:hypothetical protein
MCGVVSFCCLCAQFERTTTNDDNTRKNATPGEKEQGPYGVTLQQTTEGLPCPHAALPCFNGNSNQGTQPTHTHMKQGSRVLVFTNPSSSKENPRRGVAQVRHATNPTPNARNMSFLLIPSMVFIRQLLQHTLNVQPSPLAPLLTFFPALHTIPPSPHGRCTRTTLQM